MPSETTAMKRRLMLVELTTLAMVLPGIAGAVNAAGFFVVGSYLSHITGTVARAGDDLALGQYSSALTYLMLIAAFFFGAALASVQIEVSRRLNRPKYAFTLLTEALLLGGFALLCALTPDAWHRENLPLMAVVVISMGLQNAMVTRLSGAVVRTTHMTGIVTDLGIETARLAFLARDQARGKGLWAGLASFASIGRDPEAKRVKLLTIIFASFFAGALLGPLVYLQFGYWGAIGPTAILAALALLDIAVGIEWHPEVHFVPAGRPAYEQFLKLVAAELAANPQKAKAALDMLRRRSTSAPALPAQPDEPAPDAEVSFTTSPKGQDPLASKSHET